MAEDKVLEGIRKALEGAKPRKFKESVEICINLKDVDLSVPKNRIDEDIPLPKSRGKGVKVALFGTNEMTSKAKNVADRVLTPEDIDKLADNKRDARKLALGHQYFVAEAPLMPTIGKKLGKVLAPRGKMPRPIPPGSDPSPVLNAVRNSVKVRSRDRRTFHATVGSRDMSAEDLAANVDAVMKRILARLERGPANIHSVFVKTTMGPAMKIM
ncbi:MAG: 50S ribosomal protein L1 [Euryarchaeota archaeon]|nr:50S ribosomal protein L1 [Euryarchaeota archaeon]